MEQGLRHVLGLTRRDLATGPSLVETDTDSVVLDPLAQLYVTT